MYCDRIDFDVMVDKLKKKYTARAEQKDIKFVVELGNVESKIITNEIDFYSDESKLLSIVDNLLDNSFESTDEGLIKLSIGSDLRRNCI